jgi:hypothetical protein
MGNDSRSEERDAKDGGRTTWMELLSSFGLLAIHRAHEWKNKIRGRRNRRTVGSNINGTKIQVSRAETTLTM